MAESIREWLDNEVKAGYGAKFASAFEEVGVEDKSDLHDMDDELMKTLEAELQAVDAKPMHLTKIRKAIEAIVAPASATRAKLNAARAAGPDLQQSLALLGVGIGGGADAPAVRVVSQELDALDARRVQHKRLEHSGVNADAAEAAGDRGANVRGFVQY